VSLDLINNRFVFDVVPQRDTLVVFSQEFDNINSAAYKMSLENYASTAYAKGPGETMIVAVGSDASGLERFETFLDITDAADLAELAELAAIELAEKKPVETVSAEVVPNDTFVYERDYFLGDLVTVRNVEQKVTVKIQITEVVESWDASGHKITPLFGDQELTVGRYLKKLYYS
jgi:hypothetical protein